MSTSLWYSMFCIFHSPPINSLSLSRVKILSMHANMYTHTHTHVSSATNVRHFKMFINHRMSLQSVIMRTQKKCLSFPFRCELSSHSLSLAYIHIVALSRRRRLNPLPPSALAHFFLLLPHEHYEFVEFIQKTFPFHLCLFAMGKLKIRLE